MSPRLSRTRAHTVALLVLSLALGSSACLSAGIVPAERSPTRPAATRVSPSQTPVEPTANQPATAAIRVPELATYTNHAYGFSFRYPSAWSIMEGQNFVSLSQGSRNLVIGYRHVTEDPNICCRDRLPEGEVVEAGTVTCAGERVDKALLVCEGKTKAVIYEGTEEIALGDLRFLFYVEDFSADYDAADISDDVLAQVDRVIRSLETFRPAASFETATPRPTALPPTPEPTTEPTATSPTPTPAPAIAEVKPGGANLRSGPGTDYALAGYLEPGEQVEITAQHEGWWRVKTGNTEAWVSSAVVDADNVESVPEVEATPTRVPPSPTLIPTAAPPSAIEDDRWIDVDLSEQRLRAYENGDVVRTTPISTGLPETPTVKGQFRIWIKLRYDDMEGPDYYLEDVPYVMYFYQGYGLHGTYWHSNFGQPMSHGCVNLPTSEAEWVFNFVDVGTLVNVHE